MCDCLKATLAVKQALQSPPEYRKRTQAGSSGPGLADHPFKPADSVQTDALPGTVAQEVQLSAHSGSWACWHHICSVMTVRSQLLPSIPLNAIRPCNGAASLVTQHT